MGWQQGGGFPLDEATVMVRDAVRSFAENVVWPLAAELDREHRFPQELVADLAELGLFGVVVPEAYGGVGLPQTTYALIIEELAAACASTSIIISAHNSLCCAPIVSYGSEDQKQQYLPSLATGEWLGCFALSEPGTGSDAAALTCKATQDGEGFRITGTKNWITNAVQADVVILFATEDLQGGYQSVTAFVHPLKNQKGVTVGKPEDKLGIRASSTASITYDDYYLGPEAIMGKSGDGFRIAMDTLNGGRIGVAAQAVGIARAALRDALSYAQERKTFGKPICKHQSIQNYLADMLTGTDAARLLTLAAASLKDDGQSFHRQAAQAKLFASEVAMEAAIKGVQIHGGYGYVTEYPAERHLRDAKITEIYEGTSEIQRIVIAGSLLKE